MILFIEKYFKIYLLLFLVATSCEPAQQCDYPLFTIQIDIIQPSTRITLCIDDKLNLQKVYKNGFIITPKRRSYLIRNYCSDSEYIKIKCRINDFPDSTFIVDKRKTPNCLMGTDTNGRFSYSLHTKDAPIGKFFD